MKRMLLASTITALLLAGPAFAGNGHGHGGKHHGKGGKDEAVVVLPVPGRVPGVRVDTRDTHGPAWKAAGRHDNGLHLGQRKQEWARGERLPRTYLESQYYVRDYRTFGLVPPPPGMVWVRPYPNDRDFYLVQTATGLISQILGR